MRLPGAFSVEADLCSFGMSSHDMHGPGSAKKPTKFMMNATHIAEWLGVGCTGGHRHAQLLSGRAKTCEVYPTKLCEALLRRLKDQLVASGRLRSDGSLMISGHENDSVHD